MKFKAIAPIGGGPLVPPPMGAIALNFMVYPTMKITDKLIQQFCFNKLGVEIYDTDLDRSHRLFTKSVSTDPAIIAKFVTHNIKSGIYFRKRYLKKARYLITESLAETSKKCMEKLERQRKQKEIYAFCSIDGMFHFKISANQQKITIDDYSTFLDD